MSLEDRYVTPTPEGVSLDVVLAGLGSRFAALALDVLLQAIVFIICVWLVAIAGSGGSRSDQIVTAALIFLLFILVFIGYFVVCEMLWSGKSVGKVALGIRVVKLNGTAPGFLKILLRNVARIVDFLPLVYVVGSISIIASSNNQRLGDMLSGTIVIRVRDVADKYQPLAGTTAPTYWATPVVGSTAPQHVGPPLPEQLQSWDVSQVSDAEMSLIRQFLTRRFNYSADARVRLASQLRERIESRVSASASPMTDERFLESVSRVRASRQR